MLNRLSFKKKLIIIIALLILIPILTVSGFNIHQFMQMNKTAARSASEGLRKEAEKSLELSIKSARNDIELIAQVITRNAQAIASSKNLIQFISTSDGNIEEMNGSIKNRINSITDFLTILCNNQIKLIEETQENIPKIKLTETAKKFAAQEIEKIRIGKKGYSYVLDSQGVTVVHPVEKLRNVNVIKDLKVKELEPVISTKEASHTKIITYTYNNEKKFVSFRYVPEWDWIISTSGLWPELASEALSSLTSELADITENSTAEIKGAHKKLIEKISFIRPDGDLFFSFSDKDIILENRNVKNQKWFKEMLKSESVYNSGAIIPEGSENTVMIVSAPVFSNNQLKGYAVITMNWDIIWEKLSGYKYGSGYVSVTNENAVILSHPKYSLKHGINLTNPKFGELSKIAVEDLVTGREGIRQYVFEGVEKIFAFSPLKIGEKTYSIAANIPVEEFLASVNALKKESEEKLYSLYKMIALSTFIFSFAGILTGFFFSSGISRQLGMIAENLKAGSDELYNASEQISDSSQQLAEEASRQAAGIEETSSAIEELTQMISSNSQNAAESENIMKETISSMILSSKGMKELSQSMGSISKSSEETFKIIRTIDEIAFQTNLLALNAAVEAARAGEAGAGFAVVADEVRSLASKASNAAKDTSLIIQGTVKKIEDTTKTTEKTYSDFLKLQSNAEKIKALISEIASASMEQSHGVKQISTATSELDQITQKNASNAEESASASEELSTQAHQVANIVKELVSIIEGRRNAQENTNKKISAGKKLYHKKPRLLKQPLKKLNW
jgi:hypothetical protein